MSENFLSRQSQKKQEEIDFYNRSLRGGDSKKGKRAKPYDRKSPGAKPSRSSSSTQPTQSTSASTTPVVAQFNPAEVNPAVQQPRRSTRISAQPRSRITPQLFRTSSQRSATLSQPSATSSQPSATSSQQPATSSIELDPIVVVPPEKLRQLRQVMKPKIRHHQFVKVEKGDEQLLRD